MQRVCRRSGSVCRCHGEKLEKIFEITDSKKRFGLIEKCKYTSSGILLR